MNVLIYGIILFLIAFFIHLLIWRWHLPKHHTKALLQIFFIILLCGIFLLWRPPQLLKFYKIFSSRWSGDEVLGFIFLFVSLTLAYITTYSAVEVDSPSLIMVLRIGQAGPEGLSQERLLQIMNDDFLIKPRVRDLLADQMVFLDKDKYKLTRKGIFLTKIFMINRKLLKMPKGG